MLDIGIVIPELAKYGGAERLLIECLVRWQDRHQLTVYATRFDNDLLAEHQVSPKVRRVTLTEYFENDHAFVLNGSLLPKIWEREIGRHDLYHGHLWPTHLINRRPFVWYPHEPPRMLQDLRHSLPVEDNDANRKWKVHCYPKYSYDSLPDATYEASLDVVSMIDQLGRPDRIVANSHYTARCLERVYNCGPVDVVYPGVDVSSFDGEQGDDGYFLVVGQLWPHKRVKTVIEAVSMADGVRLVVVGDGPERTTLERTATHLGLQDRVEFKPRVDNEQLRRLYRRCRAVVFAAHNEPFGIVALETLAAGKPLIAAGEGGYVEVVDERSALFVAPRPKEIADAMTELMTDPDRAGEMGRIGREQVAGYTWDATAEKLERILAAAHNEWLRSHPSERASNTRHAGPLVGVQYYCWYGEGAGGRHWNDNQVFGGVTDMPELGYYASSDGNVIKQHLTMLENADVDFLILNVHVDDDGPNEHEAAAVKRIFSVAESEKSPLKLCLQLCPYTRNEDRLTEAFADVKDLCQRDAYFRLERKPVLFVFWSGVYDQDGRLIAFMREQTRDFCRIASSLRLYSARDEHYNTYDLFDGFCFFSPLELSAPDHWETVWSEGYRNADAGARNLRIVTLSPGYDDSHLQDPQRAANPHRSIPREDGRTYERMMDFALSTPDPPHLVVVSTFNEFHENTHIETSQDFQDRYLEATQQFIRRLRSHWPSQKQVESV